LWSNVRRTLGSRGYTRSEAKRWFKMVYDDQPNLHLFANTHYRHIGAAVGYQAIRVWEHQHNTYRIPLNPDREREREQLAGLAIAEASKLWDRWIAQAHHNSHSHREKCIQTAVATAEYIFDNQYDRGDSHYENAFRDQGYASTSGYARGRARSFNTHAEDYPNNSGYTRSRRNSTYADEPMYSRSRRNSSSYPAGPMVVSQPIPMQPTYQHINGYTVSSAPPQTYMPGARSSPNAVHLGLASSPPGLGFPYVSAQEIMPQPQYAFPTQNYNGYSVAGQPMGGSPQDYSYMPTTPNTLYRQRTRSVNFQPTGY